MKQNFLLAVLVIAGLASCKETGPVPDTNVAIAADTTYTVATAPAAQTRAFLIEDFSGIKCVACVGAHEFIAAADSQYSGRIVPITMHIFAPGFVQSYPNFDITPVVDFRTQDGTSIFNNIYHSPTTLPTIGISRTLENNNIQIQNRVSHLQSLMNTATPVNINLTSTYDSVNRKSLIKVLASYTGLVTKKQALTIALVEDNLSGPQDDTDPNTGNTLTINTYTHNHILRKIYTATSGSPVLDSMTTKSAGRVYQRVISIDVDPTWKAENCKIIAYISNNEPGDDKEVLQAAQVKLKL